MIRVGALGGMDLRRVLVIDDEADMREMLALSLSLEGFIVETADSGRAAVRWVELSKFDVAVTDLRMPEMDGIETIVALRAVDPDLPVIVATAYASSETAALCEARGAFGFIAKPYDMAEMLKLLRRALVPPVRP